MSDSGREQRPLLYDDISEEEKQNSHYEKRFRTTVIRGRARNHLKGAAAIIKLWPEFWSSAVTYWWIGLGMIAIITFMIYNSIGALAVASAENFERPRLLFQNFMKDYNVDDTQSIQALNIYMHLIVEPNVEIDVNEYISYIDRLSSKYPDFNYHLIIVTNDTDEQTPSFKAEENNEVALDLLWTKNHVKRNKDLNIVQVTLSKYMECSPLHEHWKKVPKQFMPFLTRAISIWNRGGIAFDPRILQPHANLSSYVDKLHKTIANFQTASKKTSMDQKHKERNHLHQESKKMNNIRDIINALENDKNVVSDVPPNLLEAESNHKVYISDSKQLRQTRQASRLNSESHLKTSETTIHNEGSSKHIHTHGLESNETLGLLDKFLGYLFQKQPNTEVEQHIRNQHEIKNTRERKHIETPNNGLITKSFTIYTRKPEAEPEPQSHDYEPIIFAAKPQHNNTSPHEVLTMHDEVESYNQFTIDLKGYIIASLIPCHAFLGTVFGHSTKYSNESVTDLIIKELSVFCKGVLSSCNGIDVILV